MIFNAISGSLGFVRVRRTLNPNFEPFRTQALLPKSNYEPTRTLQNSRTPNPRTGFDPTLIRITIYKELIWIFMQSIFYIRSEVPKVKMHLKTSPSSIKKICICTLKLFIYIISRYMLDMAQRAHYVSRFDTHYPRLETYHANKEQCLI